jgi:hypothetical protein
MPFGTDILQNPLLSGILGDEDFIAAVLSGRGSMSGKIAVLTAMLFILTSCHGYVPPRFDPALYPYSYEAYDLTYSWNVEKKEASITITGFAQSTRLPYIKNLELTLSLLDESGKTLGQVSYFFIPPQLTEEKQPFTVTLPVKPGTKPAKIKFFYEYHLVDKEYDNRYTYHFETPL